MKTSHLFILIFSVLILSSCNKNSGYGNPEVDFSILQKDYMSWWNYYSKNIILSSDFISLDENSNIISKENFLVLLTSGDYIPIRLSSKDTLLYYKLCN
ncbi:MAG: hypothetical protein JHC39_04485 [Lentimicrobium sp.]|nr:hypothetical protein [Lentimicrobium sp.]